MNETMQQEYDRLLKQICGVFAVDYTLEKPIRFRLTPHSNDVWIDVLKAGVNVEQHYGQAKWTVMQTLRLLNSKLCTNTK